MDEKDLERAGEAQQQDPAVETEEIEQAEEYIPALVLGDDDERDPGLHERILSEDRAWHGKIFDIDTLQVELPNGHTSRRDIVRHCGAAAIVALTETGKIALVRQYRTALDRVTVEIPAGKLDPGEDPEECARRECHDTHGAFRKTGNGDRSAE